MPTDCAKRLDELGEMFYTQALYRVEQDELIDIARALLAESAEQAELFKKAHRSTRERVAELEAENERLKESMRGIQQTVPAHLKWTHNELAHWVGLRTDED